MVLKAKLESLKEKGSRQKNEAEEKMKVLDSRLNEAQAGLLAKVNGL
jgi:hypothetical protein